GDAATADDLEAVYRLKGDLQERLLDAKRKQIVKRSMTEIESLGDLVMQSERQGVPGESARRNLEQARKAIVAGDIDGFEHGLAGGSRRGTSRSRCRGTWRRKRSRGSGRLASARSSPSGSASGRKPRARSRSRLGSRTNGSSTRTATRSATRRRSRSRPRRRTS